MTSLMCIALASWLALIASAAADWRADVVPAPGRVTAVETVGKHVRVAIGQSWYRLASDPARLESASPPDRPAAPAGALPDARVATGIDTIARAWLAEPTSRYRHGVLGDAIEAGSLIFERRDGRRGDVRLGADAVFEDIEPRIARIGGSERIVVVKSYLDRGSALAIIHPDSATIIAETPPIGHPNAWLNPAGIGDFNGDGASDIALVRQPHVVGRLELWSWLDGKLNKTDELADASNHFIGSRALGMSSTADFNGDGRPDLAVPSLDRRTLRLITFMPQPHDIARVLLPARVATNISAIVFRNRPALVAGLENGQLILVHD
jgi:FG-GAP-like repeat